MSDTEELNHLLEELEELEEARAKIPIPQSKWDYADSFFKWCLFIYCLSAFHLLYEYSPKLDEMKQFIVVRLVFLEFMLPICFFLGIISLGFIQLLSARRSLIIFLHCPLFILINGFLTRQAFICIDQSFHSFNTITAMSKLPETVVATAEYAIKMYVILGLILIGIMVLTCFDMLKKDSSSVVILTNDSNTMEP